jgi:hypothetical protein
VRHRRRAAQMERLVGPLEHRDENDVERKPYEKE